MNFKTHNQTKVKVGGTSLVGEIVTNYKTLKKLFGKPHGSDGYKSDAEWYIEFEDGLVATIYNWKDGKNYCGKSGLPKSKITDWHIGGIERVVVNRIQEMIEKYENSLVINNLNKL